MYVTLFEHLKYKGFSFLEGLQQLLSLRHLLCLETILSLNTFQEGRYILNNIFLRISSFRGKTVSKLKYLLSCAELFKYTCDPYILANYDAKEKSG